MIYGILGIKTYFDDSQTLGGFMSEKA